jgi:hypothetical protein
MQADRAGRPGPYQPQVPGAEFGLGVRWRVGLTSGVQSEPVGNPPVVVLTSGVVACRGVVPLPDSSVTHRCVLG